MKLHIKVLAIALAGIVAISLCTLLVGALVIQKTSLNLSMQFLDATAQKGLQRIEAAQLALVDAGTVGVEQFEKNARAEVLKSFSQDKLTDGQTVFIADAKGTILFHPKMAAGESSGIADFEMWKSQKIGRAQINIHSTPHLAIYRYFEPWDWFVVASTESAFVNAPQQNFLKTAGSIVFILMGISVATLVSFLRRNVTRRLKILSEVAHAVAQGRLERIAEPTSSDELAELQQAFTKVCEANSKKAKAAQEIALGKLDVQIPEESEFDVLGQSMRDMLDNLKKISAAKNATAVVLDLVQSLSAELQPLSQSAEVQQRSVAQVTNTLKELATRFQESSSKAKEVTTISEEAKQKANENVERVRAIVASMERVAESNAAIEKIAKMIDDIAFQTNLLALNASVEAAHAGKHGRGFAVVANEVRALAQRSTDAVSETNAKISEVLQAAYEGKALVDVAAGTFEEIRVGNEKISDLNKIVVELGTKAEQAVETTKLALDAVSQASQDTDLVVMRMTSSVESLRVSSEDMRAVMAEFH